MGWEDLIVLEVPGLDSSDLPGFVQSVDLPVARQWMYAATQRTSQEAERAAKAGGWHAQLKATQRALEAVGNVYRSLNLSWIADPAAAEIWHEQFGAYNPIDPSPICTAQTLGPTAIATGTSWGPRLAHGIDPQGPEGRAWRAAHPYIVPAIRAVMRAAWIAIKGPLPTRSVEVFNEARFDYARRVEIARELGYPIPDPPPDLPPAQYTQEEIFDPVLIAPGFLDYQSRARVLDTKNPSSGTAGQKFDGVFTGAGCYDPNTGWTAVARDAANWSWECIRWDDAPLNALRMLPPLRTVFGFARLLAESFAVRGARRIVMDARIHQVLTNLERAKEFAEGELEGFDEALYETLKQNRALRFDATRDRELLKAVSSAVCGTASLAGGAPGLVCAGAAAAYDAVLGLLPKAVGCWVDEWGQILPSAVRAQISMDVPPKFTVTPPDDVTFPVFDQYPRIEPIKMDIRTVGPLVPGKDKFGTFDPPKPPPPPSPVPEAESNAGAVALGIGALALVGLALRGRR